MSKKIYIDTNFATENVIEELGKLFPHDEVEFVNDQSLPSDLKIRLHEYTEKVSQKFGIISFYNKDQKIARFVQDTNALVTHKYDFLEFDDYYEDVDIFYILGKTNNKLNIADLATAVSNYVESKVIEYSIVYNLDGGTNSPDNPAKYTSLTSVELKNATKEGFVFDGWYGTPDFSDEKVTSIPLGSTGDKTLYAKFTPESE